MAPKNERFELRLDEDILARIDIWLGQQDGVPTRAEAMRRLMETGLAKASPHAITFSAGHKFDDRTVVPANKHLKVKGEIDPDLPPADGLLPW